MTMTSEGPVSFGPYEVTKQVFLTTPLSFALVNLKPLIPGHVLVCPRTAHERLTDLSPGETADLFATVQLTQRLLARTYFGDAGAAAKSKEPPSSSSGSSDEPARPAGSFTVAVQDGPEAGQTVPHVHVHVIPRTRDDLGEGAAGDDVYVRLAAEAGNVGGALAVRTPEQMHDEAERYRATLRDMGVEQGDRSAAGGSASIPSR
ncbi:HIT domain-containing protein [Hirsutella rhossiliensis]|uniref:Bis(5'-adenosyl)-triphosphatase n=1 Tax=Hirsutella rhossiliensis TaxID=111463 RepID=A0A9P8SKV6_9HYPO|nr:HIT domain-containing protein [Hirsutella rhossiliensis]KAH0965629.1 HIT domain-containing protein [Hirsutella rhossiliensis]